MIKTDKLLRLKTRKGKFLNVVREHYLRDDIACHSELCSSCDQGDSVVLSSELTHYVIPDCQVARNYLEIFESPDVQGVIFFQTVTNNFQHGSRKLQSHLKSILTDSRQQCVTFSNEFLKDAYVSRQPGETLEAWQRRCIYSGIVSYYNHLSGGMPLVFVTEDPEATFMYGDHQDLGIFVMNMDDYLNNFFVNHSDLLDLYDSLASVLAESQVTGQEGNAKEFSEYLPIEVLEAGVKSGRYIKGCLNVNKHNAQLEAFVQKSGSEGVSGAKGAVDSDVFIPGARCRNRAVHGDMVAVELLPQSQWKGRSTALRDNEQAGEQQQPGEPEDANCDVVPTGRVVGVLQRNWRDYVASFAEDEEIQQQRKAAGKVIVIPWDYRIPKIRISTRQVDSLRDQRIIVRLDGWPVGSMYPNGHFVRSLGPIGNLETEISALMVENSLAAPSFTEAQLRELPKDTSEDPWVMPQGEVSRRRDIRKSHLVFSIDPKGCEDVDDTLSVRKLKKGNLELGVHIADVSYFVKPSSLTDAEAQSRSTTVYLADRRYDMLPEVLSARLCSLICGVDRMAVSVFWELDQDYNVLKTWFGRTVIRSSYKLFYEAAQIIADGEVSDAELIQDIPELQSVEITIASKKISEIRWSVLQLMDIARVLKARRTIKGALELEGLEVQIQLTDKKDIKDLIPKKPLEVHETVAECMIFANHWVAKKIVESFPTASLLRHHPLPRQQYFANLAHCAKSKGFTIHTSSNKALAESLDQCVDPEDPTFNKLLRSLATQAMSNALYFSTGSLAPDEFFHYGLALERYTHFTSPIRRYADVIVHRLLMAAVDRENFKQPLHNEQLQELCQHINKKHRAAQNAQRESVELFQTLYFQDLAEDDERRVADAVIFSLRPNGLLVFVPRYGLRGAVYLKDKSGRVVCPEVGGDAVAFGVGSLLHRDFHITIQGSSGDFDFRLFDHVQVRITVLKSRTHAQSLRMELVSMETRQRPPPGEMQTEKQSQNMKRAELVQEVKSSREDQGNAQSHDHTLNSEMTRLKAEFGQSHESVSLYYLMEYFKELSLMEDT